MLSNKLPDKEADKKKQVNDIIDILFSNEELNSDSADEIRRWLAEGEFSELKEDALRRKFTDSFKFADESRYAKEMWPALAKRVGISYDPFITRQSVPSKPLYRRLSFRVAAVISPFILLAGILTHLYTGPDNDIIQDNGFTDIIPLSDNGISTVVLPDGSIVEMKEGSEIFYADDFAENRFLEFSGEAYFKVAKKRGSAFVISSGDITVTVTGTEFNLTSFKDAPVAEIKLTTGKVSVYADDIGEMAMETGQYFFYNKEEQSVEVNRLTETERLELMGISLDFHTTLDEILHTMARYLDLTMEIEPGVETDREIVVPFEGTESTEEIMDLLRYMTGDSFDYLIERDTVFIALPL